MTARHFNIADLFEIVADTVPEREAIACGEERQTYGSLEERATRLANFMRERGVGAGDKVGLYMYNSNAYIEGMLACFKLRAVPVNVNYRYVDEELSYIFNNADMVACIHHREFVPHIAKVRHAAPGLKLLIAVEDGSDAAIPAETAKFEEAMAAGSPARDFGERSDDDLFILYTGGTTGKPKGVMWPHKDVFYAAMGGGGHFHPAGAIQAPEDIAIRAKEGLFHGPLEGLDPLSSVQPMLKGRRGIGRYGSLVNVARALQASNVHPDGPVDWEGVFPGHRKVEVHGDEVRVHKNVVPPGASMTGNEAGSRGGGRPADHLGCAPRSVHPWPWRSSVMAGRSAASALRSPTMAT
jgi:acyl-CoA synthetase (AMP-forming)/AMP-acid ligase II